MWVISKAKLQVFWEACGGDAARVRKSLLTWYTATKQADWNTWADLKQTFGSADVVGDCVAFDVLGNDYRLVGRVRFKAHKVYVLRVMTHREYDRNLWVRQCGCHLPPPVRLPRKPRGGR